MGNRKIIDMTPKGVIVAALRQLWMRSRERGFTLKRDKYCCKACGKKQSKAQGREVKIEVDHKKGHINWDEIVSVIRKHLLVDSKYLQVLCKECHAKKTSEERNDSTKDVNAQNK